MEGVASGLQSAPAPTLVAHLWNKANFPLYQPCLSGIDFWVVSSQIPLSVTWPLTVRSFPSTFVPTFFACLFCLPEHFLLSRLTSSSQLAQAHALQPPPQLPACPCKVPPDQQFFIYLPTAVFSAVTQRKQLSKYPIEMLLTLGVVSWMWLFLKKQTIFKSPLILKISSVGSLLFICMLMDSKTSHKNNLETNGHGYWFFRREGALNKNRQRN